MRTGHSRHILSSAVGDRTEDEGYQIACENTNDRLWGSCNNNYMTLAGMESLLKFKPQEQCPNITVPILFLHGSEDELVDPEEGRSMCALCASEIKEFRLLEGLDHNMPINPRCQEVFDHVVDWFERYL